MYFEEYILQFEIVTTAVVEASANNITELILNRNDAGRIASMLWHVASAIVMVTPDDTGLKSEPARLDCWI